MTNKFELLEKKLNIASELMDELNLDDIEEVTECDIIPAGKYEVAVSTNDEIKPEIFTIESLKSDFVAIRNNVMKLINTGQRILESASLIDIADMKPQHLNALSDMQSTLGSNLKLMISLYKEIAEIEKLRIKESKHLSGGAGAGVAPVNNGTIVNNQIVYSGSTEDLLALIKENQNI